MREGRERETDVENHVVASGKSALYTLKIQKYYVFQKKTNCETPFPFWAKFRQKAASSSLIMLIFEANKETPSGRRVRTVMCVCVSPGNLRDLSQ